MDNQKQLYDLIFVEDEEIVRESMLRQSSSQKVNAFGVESLDELTSLLSSNSTGKAYVVDGRFPKTKDGAIEDNAGKAIELIRQYDPNAQIFIYSSAMRITELAKSLGVEFFEKGRYLPKDVVANIKLRIN